MLMPLKRPTTGVDGFFRNLCVLNRIAHVNTRALSGTHGYAQANKEG